MWLQILQGLAYALTAASAADQIMQEPGKVQATGSPAGGSSQPQAQQFFSQGQPMRAPNQPSPVVPETSPMLSAQIGQLLAGTPSAMEGYGLESGKGPLLPKTNVDPMLGLSEVDITAQKMPQPAAPGTNSLVGNLGNMADAIKAMAPLLFPDDRKGLTLGGAAGGQPGQNIFQLPQRQTLTQILASLPRTM